MGDLYNTSVPVPFELHYAVSVDDSKETEELLHDLFGAHQENPRREFFRVDPESVVAAMKLTKGDEVVIDDSVYDASDSDIGKIDIEARERSRKLENKKRDNFKFEYADIPVGAELVFTRDHTQKAEVLGGKKICFRGEEATLSGSAKIILKEMGDKGDSFNGTLYWAYNDKILAQIRSEKEAESEL